MHLRPVVWLSLKRERQGSASIGGLFPRGGTVEQSEPTLFPVPPFPLTTSSEANRGTMRVACFLERGEQVKRKARIQLSFPAVVGGNSSMVE